MATQSTARGSVTLRKLRSGTTATVSLSSTMQLFQLFTYDNGTVKPTPAWNGAHGTYPEVSVNVAGDGVSIQDVQWFIDNVNVTNGTAINGVSESVNNGVHTLKINADLADNTHTSSRTLTAIITLSDGTQVAKSEVIRIQQAVENGYYVMINADRTWVDESNQANLTAVCYRGTSDVTSSVSFFWYDSNLSTATSLNSSSSSTLTVNANMVNGSQLFICRAIDNNNTELDAEGVTIVDNSDSLYISASVQQKIGGQAQGTAQDNVTSVNVEARNDNTVVTFCVVDKNGVAYPGAVSSWEIMKMHADTMKPIGEVKNGSNTVPDITNDNDSGSVSNPYAYSTSNTITVFDKDYNSVGSATTATSAHLTEVVVTATATL